MFRFWVKWPVRGSSETWSSKLTTNFSKYFFYSDSRRWCKGCTLKCKSCRWRRALWIDWCYENMEKQMELKVKPGPYIILKFHKCHPLNATFPATHQQKSLRIEFPYFLVWTKKNLSRKFRNLLFYHESHESPRWQKKVANYELSNGKLILNNSYWGNIC